MSTSIEGDNCGICFTSIHPQCNPRGKLNSCGHIFCAYCIKKWAESTNVCPHCKARFTTITVSNTKGKNEVKKVRKRNYKLWELSDSESEGEGGEALALPRGSVRCGVCGEGDNAIRMIFCDRSQCDYTVHLDCVGMSDRPSEFFCSECRAMFGEGETSTCPPPNAGRDRSCTPTEDNGSSSSPSSNVCSPAPPPCTTTARKISVPPPAFLREAMERSAGKRLRDANVENRSETPVMPRRNANDWSPEGGYVNVDNGTINHAAQTAMQQYLQRMEQRAHREKLQCAHRPAQRQRGGDCLRQNTQLRLDRRCAQVRSAANAAEMEALLNPITRQREEERLARQLAKDLMPVLRRNQYLKDNRLVLDSDGCVVMNPPPSELEASGREAELYSQAMVEGRRMAQQRISAKVASARLRKEQLLLIQAEREALALNQLAMMIASRRTGGDPKVD